MMKRSQGSFREVLRRQGRHSDWLFGLIALVFGLPSLGAGMFNDDIWQRWFVLGHLDGTRGEPWWQLFGIPHAGSVPGFVFYGLLPWWTSPHFQLAFFRPLAAATHFIDYVLWPHLPSLMHLQSVLLYATLCVVVAKFYRRLLPGVAVAMTAALLYALDEAHLEAVAWISARNSVLTAIFCALTLLFLERQRESGSARWIALSALSLVLAHFSSEGALAVWAYILGWALFLARHPLPATLLRLTPVAVVSLAFSVFTAHSGYTAVGGGVYVDPRVRPIEFAHVALVRFPVLLWEELGPPAWLVRMAEHTSLDLPLKLACAAGWLLVCAIALPRIWRRPELRALFVGMLGSTLAICAVRPEPRLLLIVGLGAHALCGALLVECWQSIAGSEGLRRVLWQFGTIWLVMLHLALAPVGSFAVPAWYRGRHERFLNSAATMDIGAADADRVVAILNGPSYFDALSICTYRIDLTPHPWRAVHILGASTDPVTISRPDSNSVTLEPTHGYLLESTSQQARSADEPFAAGQVIPLEGLSVIVEAITATGRPQRIRLSLPAADDQGIVFLNWDQNTQTFRRFSLPPVGRRALLPR
jgi:hypothetical protein